MAETHTEDSTIVLDLESRITELETSFKESIEKMLKLLHKAMGRVPYDEFDNLLEIVKCLFQDQEGIKTGLEGLKAEFQNYQKKSGEKKKQREAILEAVEGFCNQEAEIPKILDKLKNEVDSDVDDDSYHFEIDMSIEEVERELYSMFYGVYKDGKKVDEGSSSTNEGSLHKDPKIVYPSSSSDSSDAEWYKAYPKSDLLKQDSDRESVIEGLKQDFKKLELGFARGGKIKDMDRPQEDCSSSSSSSSSRQMNEGSGFNKSHSI